MIGRDAIPDAEGARMLRPGPAAALAETRFADVRWRAETGSTNADALALARSGEREGIVLVADHQTAGRGRRERTWEAAPGAALLASVLLRPRAEVADLATMAVGVAAVDAVHDVTGLRPRLKWPNDLVIATDGAPGPVDRKLAGILAEADWPQRNEDRVVVVVGIGLNVRWEPAPPAELAEVAVCLEELCGHHVSREELLAALLTHLDTRYRSLDGRDRTELLAAWRQRSATLGRRVRVDLGTEDVEGIAVDVTGDGHLVVETADGDRRTLAVGDVVHLRST